MQGKTQMFPLKVAVAMAIIKGKPEHISGQKHAEMLQRKFMLKQSQLESCYAEARLKISKLEEQISKSNTKYHDTEITKGDEILQIVTPPSSNDTQHKANSREFGCHHDIEMITSEVEHSKFIQSVVRLENLTSSSQRLKSDEIMVAAIDNISSLSDVLSRHSTTLPESCLCKAAEAITKLLNCHSWLEDIDKIMEGVCRLIETVLSKIKGPSSQHQFPPHRQKHSLMQMLVAFLRTSSPHLSVIILDSLMDAWEKFCHDLRNTRKTRTPLDPQVFESSFFIIRTTELTVKSWTIHCNLNFNVLIDLQERLEKSLLLLRDYFPLMAQAVWKVTAIIEKCLQGHTTRL